MKSLILDGKKLSRFILILFLITVFFVAISYFCFDQKLAVFFRKDENLNYWIVAREITNIGLGQHYFTIVFILLGFCYGLAPRTRWGRTNANKVYSIKVWAWNFLAALICAGFFLRLFKFIFGRARPHISADSIPNKFEYFTNDWNYHSFPSGHTQVLFTVATMLIVADPKRTPLWLTLASLLAFTRVVTYSHFLSDTIAGAFVGFAGSLIGIYIMQRWSRFQLFRK